MSAKTDQRLLSPKKSQTLLQPPKQKQQQELLQRDRSLLMKPGAKAICDDKRRRLLD